MTDDLQPIGVNAAGLLAQLERIRASRPPIPEAVYRCACRDTGFTEHTDGEFDVGSGHRHTLAHASERNPIVTRCPKCNGAGTKPAPAGRTVADFS